MQAKDLIVTGASRLLGKLKCLGDISTSGKVTATNGFEGNVVGNVSGSAGTAGAFTSAKSITLTGDVTGSASSTGGWSIATTVKDDSHNHTASTLSGVALSTDIGRIYYGSVDSTSTSTVFTATINGITEYKEGLTVVLKNGVVTSASGFTININGLGAKHVYTNLAASSADTTIFNINYTMMFIYENRVSGGNWLCYRGYDSNSNDTTSGYARFSHGTYTTTTAVGRYVICLTKSPTSVVPVTAVNNSTATTKALTTDTFNPFEPIFYFTNNGSTTQTAANKALTASYLWTTYSNINLGYSFNTGSTLTTNKDVYIKATPTDGYMAKLASTPIVQDLPTSDDGFIYIKLGHANSTSNIAMAFDHPIYYYKNGEIRIWTNPTTSDWDESNSTSPSYIENRTHYRTSLGYSYPLSGNASQWSSGGDMTFGNVTKTYTYQSYNLSVTSNQFNHSAFDSTVTSVVASVTTNGTTTNQTLSVYVEDHLNEEYPYMSVIFYNDSYAFCLTIEPYGDEYDHYFNSIFINHNLIGISDDLMEVTLNNLNVPVVEEEYEYTKKLDNRYLNGKLITSGTGYGSEIFNSSDNNASGDYSHAEGTSTTASGAYSHAEGSITTAFGNQSHAEGYCTTASGGSSHAEGSYSKAFGSCSHAEGYYIQLGWSPIKISGEANTNTYTTTSSLTYIQPEALIGLTLYYNGITGEIVSYTVNSNNSSQLSSITLDQTLNPNTAISNVSIYPSDRVTVAKGNYSHAEGMGTIAEGEASHSEGDGTIASGNYSHAEGEMTKASQEAAHAEGYGTTASSSMSHAEGTETTASGYGSHAEGIATIASKDGAHAEGSNTTASGYYTHAEGYGTIAYSDYSHAEGGSDNSSTSLILTGEANATTYTTTSSTTYSPELLIGCKIGSSIITDITYSEKTLSSIVVDKTLSTSAISNKKYTISGIYTTAKSSTSHAEGGGTKTSGNYSHAEGWRAYASGFASHAEGGGTIAYGDYSHAEGQWTVANGKYSHAEGSTSSASGNYSHAEGISTVASGKNSHAEGWGTKAIGINSHAEGYSTTAQRKSQHVFGEFNVLDTGGTDETTRGTYVEIVGKGTGNIARSNARTLDWSGNETLAGSITIGKGTSDEVTLTPAKLKQLLALL